MNKPSDLRFDFAESLRLEADYVLEDMSFKRAPVQSRLLRYLVEAAASGGEAPGQYEIAVDALGKDPDFDLVQDSYPRVQISRLRARLDTYYARHKPRDGMRIVLEPGQYRLGLERVEEPQDTGETAPPPPRDAAQTVSEPPALATIRGYPLAHGDPPLTPRGHVWRERAKARLVLTAGLGALVVALIAFIAAERLGFFAQGRANEEAVAAVSSSTQIARAGVAGDAQKRALNSMPTESG